MKAAVVAICLLLAGCAIPIHEECDAKVMQWKLIPNFYGDMNLIYEKCDAPR